MANTHNETYQPHTSMLPEIRHYSTATMRARSPFTHLIKKKEGERHDFSTYFMLSNSTQKIHRIILKDVCTVEIVNALSPSCIWVRIHRSADEQSSQLSQCDVGEPFNHLQQAFEFDESGKTITSEGPQLYNYYLAPRTTNAVNEKLIYSRARLLRVQLQKTTICCYIHFIDYAYGEWIDAKCLAKMPKALTTIPWQTIPIALFGVFPANQWGEELFEWSSDHCKILRDLLNDYETLRVEPALEVRRLQTYDDYTRGDFVGIARDHLAPIETAADGLRSDVQADKVREYVRVAREHSIISKFIYECASRKKPLGANRGWSVIHHQPLYTVRAEISSCPQILRDLPDFNTLKLW